MLINQWPGDWKNNLKRTNHTVDDENGKAMGIWNGPYRKVCQFSSNGFQKNIGCILSAPTFGLGGTRLWEKEDDTKISGNKSKRRSIYVNIGLYEVFISYIIYCILFYFITILIPFLPSRFVVSTSLWKRISESIAHKDLSWKRTGKHINGGGKSC